MRTEPMVVAAARAMGSGVSVIVIVTHKGSKRGSLVGAPTRPSTPQPSIMGRQQQAPKPMTDNRSTAPTATPATIKILLGPPA